MPGAHVRFAKTSRILAGLAGGHADRTWDERIRELVRPDVLILDDFTMRQLNATQADDLYESVSERQGRSLIITSNDRRTPPTRTASAVRSRKRLDVVGILPSWP
ncbi:ATP-binding protein [Streptomyces sp. GESEQ-35]|uniref:ATP-binding protein n=1 Tax=Streptomyces sp. GESEQ-35 TaxID=2812657 RepID=UPI0024A6D77D|nr:ATP-binding protein [Streptomyces sp. GESEQ-35]